MKLKMTFTKGGVGSGHHGHSGRPGKRGGSAPGGGLGGGAVTDPREANRQELRGSGMFGPVTFDKLYGDGKFDNTPARKYGQDLRKAAPGKYKMTRGANAESAHFFMTKPKLSQKAVSGEISALGSKLKSDGFESYKDPMKTNVFYDKGGKSWRNGNMLVEIKGSPSSSLNFGRVNINVNRLDITATKPGPAIPFD